MLTVEEALSASLALITPLNAMTVPLAEAQGYALAEEIVSSESLPPFDNSSMDGFAIRSEDVTLATSESGARLAIIGESIAGRSPNRAIRSGEAMRIMTGAPIPDGADAVAMKEIAHEEKDAILLYEPVTKGRFIRLAGEDVSPGQRLLAVGDLLDAPRLAILAAIGYATVRVTRKPKVAILTTGDEVVDADQPLSSGQIRNSNRYGLAAMIRESGFEIGDLSHVGDDLDKTRAALLDASKDADAVLTTGGVSVGDYDFLKRALQDVGRLEFWRVAVKPGKPLLFGEIAGKPLFGLPGNPVSAMLSFELFVRPALRKMAGFTRFHRPVVTAILRADALHEPGREEYQRARLVWEEGVLAAYLSAKQGSHQLSGLLESNGLILLPSDSGDVPKGESVKAMITREMI